MIRYELDASAHLFAFGRARVGKEGFAGHSHTYTELVIITAGSGIHTADGRDYPIRAGDIFIINPELQHGFSNGRDLEMYNIGFRRESFDFGEAAHLPGLKALLDLEPLTRPTRGFTSRFHADTVGLERILATLRMVERELAERRPGCRTICVNLLTNLIIGLARDYPGSPSLSGRHLVRLSASIELIERQFTRPIGLEELAEVGGFSVDTLVRLFRAVCRTTPLQYLLQVRVSRAAELLAETDLRIGEIAERCGFEDSNYFTRLFSQRMGSSPRSYRAVCRSISAGTPVAE